MIFPQKCNIKGKLYLMCMSHIFWIQWSSNFWIIVIIFIIKNHKFFFQKNNSKKLKAEDVKGIWAHSFDTIGKSLINGFLWR
jgi:hypothetical protein